ncbi:MAG TPA: 2OG-Fe(II) oxygenase [Streptosporangiaceae bacterium]|nr:2OG-Fe(II) oxygenase [Streptosporangiaceae bacterium]
MTSRLPAGWQDDVIAAATEAEFRDFPRTPLLSREAGQVAHVSRGRVHAHQVRQRLPWLSRLYRGYFLELAARTREERVRPAADDRYSVVLNVQRGTAMRFECHVDSNPLTGLLFCTDHLAGAGGEFAFGHDPAAAAVGAVDSDCSVIRPRAGRLIFFDGRRHPHYARPLSSESAVRVVAVMNFYTESCPESTRPRELNRHLYGDS